MPDTEQQLLSMTGEAAVLVQRGRATFANAEAREILGQDCVGKRVAALFGETISGVQASSFLAQVRLREQPLAEEAGSAPLLENLRSLTRSQYQIRRLLDNASLILEQSQGGIVCAARTFDLSRLCSSALEALSRMLPGISFPDRCGEGILVHADPRLIKILLLNLLSNAVRHGEGCSRISLSLLQTGQNVVLGVELPRVFDRYRYTYRLDQMNAGPGLGLTAVRMIAQRHGGSLLLESRAGQGTTVRVSLPRPKPEQLRVPEEDALFDGKEFLTGLADCLPAGCFGEKWLD